MSSAWLSSLAKISVFGDLTSAITRWRQTHARPITRYVDVPAFDAAVVVARAVNDEFERTAVAASATRLVSASHSAPCP
jgi:hypothetical protein